MRAPSRGAPATAATHSTHAEICSPNPRHRARPALLARQHPVHLNEVNKRDLSIVPACHRRRPRNRVLSQALRNLRRSRYPRLHIRIIVQPRDRRRRAVCQRPPPLRTRVRQTAGRIRRRIRVAAVAAHPDLLPPNNAGVSRVRAHPPWAGASPQTGRGIGLPSAWPSPYAYGQLRMKAALPFWNIQRPSSSWKTVTPGGLMSPTHAAALSSASAPAPSSTARRPSASTIKSPPMLACHSSALTVRPS